MRKENKLQLTNAKVLSQQNGDLWKKCELSGREVEKADCLAEKVKESLPSDVTQWYVF